MAYEAVIGLEIHVQLNCTTKMFCDCPNRPGDDPNTNTCPICLWLPGAVPRFSLETLEKAAMACLALNCDIQPQSAFDQKVYYYPDLPKGFQLSQHHMPLSRGGWVDIIDENGKPNFEGRRSARFAKVLRTQTNLPVKLWDESYSTQYARQARIQMGVSRKKRSGHLDDIAATVILQSYLDAHRNL